jgi:hypothetical protein
MERPSSTTLSSSESLQKTKDYLIYGLLLFALIYNFHRYFVIYNIEDLANGEEITPIGWKLGKYLVVSIVLACYYFLSDFDFEITTGQWLIIIFVVFLIVFNIIGFLLHKKTITDEFEYQFFVVLLLPLLFVKKDNLLHIAPISERFLNVAQYVLIASNLVVMFNYFYFDRMPYHSYKGSVVVRFGSAWDDPNTFGIISSFFVFFAHYKRKYWLMAVHIINILATFSFTALILCTIMIGYIAVRSDKKFYWAIGLGIVAVVAGYLAIVNIEFIEAVLEAKSRSLEGHADTNFDFYWLPLQQAMQFHETWQLSFSMNYFPISIVALLAFWAFIFRQYFFVPASIQSAWFVLYFATTCFLPFPYMFPINFMIALWAILYSKEVYF